MGCLVPEIEPEGGFLYAQGSLHCAVPFGIDVDAHIVMDITEKRTLHGVELVWPASRWKLGPRPRVPELNFHRDLILSESSISRRSFDLDVQPFTDSAKAFCYITIGTDQGGQWVSLSNTSFVLINGEELTAFLFDLKPIK